MGHAPSHGPSGYGKGGPLCNRSNLPDYEMLCCKLEA